MMQLTVEQVPALCTEAQNPNHPNHDEDGLIPCYLVWLLKNLPIGKLCFDALMFEKLEVNAQLCWSRHLFKILMATMFQEIKPSTGGLLVKDEVVDVLVVMIAMGQVGVTHGCTSRVHGTCITDDAKRQLPGTHVTVFLRREPLLKTSKIGQRNKMDHVLAFYRWCQFVNAKISSDMVEAWRASVNLHTKRKRSKGDEKGTDSYTMTEDGALIL